MPARPFVPATGGYGSVSAPIPAAGKRMERTGKAALGEPLKNSGLL